jgi:hypothetical protein
MRDRVDQGQGTTEVVNMTDKDLSCLISFDVHGPLSIEP